MPITLEDIPEFEGECLRLEVVYRGKGRPYFYSQKRQAENSISTGMFYLTERKDAGMGSPAILVYEGIENGEYKKPRFMYFDYVERISPISLDSVIRNPESPLSKEEEKYLKKIKDSIPFGQASP